MLKYNDEYENGYISKRCSTRNRTKQNTLKLYEVVFTKLGSTVHYETNAKNYGEAMNNVKRKFGNVVVSGVECISDV